jgi:hypothetical protein
MAYNGGGGAGYGIFTWSLFFTWGKSSRIPKTFFFLFRVNNKITARVVTKKG